jgi:cytochrome c553
MRSTLFALIAMTTLAACGDKAEAPAPAEVTPPTPQASAPKPVTYDAAPVVNPGKLKYVAVCQGCHGNTGGGQGPFPKLAGKPAEELIAKLNDYRAGKQVGPQSSTMMPFAKALTDAEIASISEYLATL